MRMNTSVSSVLRRARCFLRGDLGELVQGASSFAIIQFLSMPLGLLYYFVLARLYGKGAIGTYALSMTIANMFLLLGALGTQRSVTRFVAATQKEQSGIRRTVYHRLLVMVVPASMITAVLLFLASPWLSEVAFGEEKLLYTLPVLAVGLPLLAIHALTRGAFLGIKRVAEASALTNLVPLAVAVLVLVGAAFFWMPERQYMVPIYAQLVGLAVTVAIGVAIWRRRVPSGGEAGAVPSYRELLTVSAPMMITAGMHLLLNWTDTLMLGYFRDVDAVGEYRIAFRVAVLNGFVLTAVNSISNPKFAETYAAQDVERLRRIARDATRLVMLATLPIFLILILAPRLVLGFFGEEFTTSASVLVVLCIGKYFSACCGPVGSFLNMTGQQVAMGRIMIGSAILNAVLNFLLIPQYGLLGAASATAVSTIAWNVSASLRVYRTHGFFFWFALPSWGRKNG